MPCMLSVVSAMSRPLKVHMGPEKLTGRKRWSPLEAQNPTPAETAKGLFSYPGVSKGGVRHPPDQAVLQRVAFTGVQVLRQKKAHFAA